MKNEIAKTQHCVLLRGDTKLWIDSDRLPDIEGALRDASKRFLKINGQLVNSFEVIGVFDAASMEERTRYKNGQWKCDKGTWHDKGHVCECKLFTETVNGHVKGVGEVTYKR